ncbi:MAG: Rid family hydrolase [Saprospiraceae bacterium]
MQVLVLKTSSKASVFVKDMNLYGRINTVYAEYFNEDTAPARELVEVT